jgi:hypothetical protein
MGLFIQDGGGKGFQVGVDHNLRLLVSSVSEERKTFTSHIKGQTYMVSVEDVAPTAGEYTLYLCNETDKELTIDTMCVNNVDSDVSWKLHEVSGTAGGASLIEPKNLNLGSGNTQTDIIVRGGAGGVTGLTSEGVIMQWLGGGANNATEFSFSGSLILTTSKSIAIEFDAGTGGKVALNILYHMRDRA